MDQTTTLTIFAASAVLALVAAWGDARRRKQPDGALALLPWHALLFVAFAGLLFMGIHLVTLLGSD